MRREAVGARCMQTVARAEFQPSASSWALTSTSMSPRSYRARIDASSRLRVSPETACALSPTSRNACATLYACRTPAAYTTPGTPLNRVLYRSATARLNGSWSSSSASISWSNSVSTSPRRSGTLAIVRTPGPGGMRTQRSGAMTPRRAACARSKRDVCVGKRSVTWRAISAQLAVELVDEVAAVREDQDAAGARGIHEAERRHGLAGARRVLEPEALGGVRVLRRLGQLLALVAAVRLVPVHRLVGLVLL